MDSITKPTAETSSALAFDLATRAVTSPHGLLFVDATGDRLDELAAAAAGFEPSLTVLTFPAWDSLPYDRSPPSAAIVGRRVATLARLAAEPGAPCLVLTSARAVLGRVPPPERWTGETITLRPGDAVQPDELAQRLHAFGYTDDEHVDEAGHVAIRSHVIDLFPGDSTAPHRLPVNHGRIEAIHRIDPGSQRSEGDGEAELVIRPVIETALDEAKAATLVSLRAYMPDAAVLMHDDVEARWEDLREQVADAHAALARARRCGTVAGGPDYLPPPCQLLAEPGDLSALLGDAVQEPFLGYATATPALHRPAAIATAIRQALGVGRVIVAAGDGASRLYTALTRRHDVAIRLATGWQDALDGPAGSAAIVGVPLASGFVREAIHVLAVPSAPPRIHGDHRLTLEEPPRFGDIVVHRGHGVCRLHGLATVGEEERVALEFAGETELLVPVSELNQIWRYGSETGAIALDRVDGESWRHREAGIAAEITATASELAAQSAARAKLKAPEIRPPAAPFARFLRRFPYPLSPDQADAIDAVLADLAAGRPMDRLVCGDVGFGKTEVALRAAAAAALAGYQVAIVAPTTVLARQHFETFRKRFAGLGVRVEKLLRGATTAEGRTVRDGLADGSIAVVVGTQAIAAEAVQFKNLALVVIDEEQRFGDVQKKRLSTLRNPGGGVHTLVMTATPIPRTLQTAMVGLRQISVIATAPVRRQATRTFVLPWDPVIVREALMREHARGGQSFAVCPRIEDTEPLAARLAELVPELSVVTAHGRLKPQALEQIVAEFAAGQHDVLLATNIIEAGLDIPRANTILVTRPDRFGLSQLHQMRGRVGRGTRRSFAYLLTEAGKTLPAPTQRRLHTLEAQEQLGAGITISLADMDARGAGDLFGEQQAGHVHAIGTELYQHLLAAELAVQRGEPRPAPPPILHTEIAARIPEDLVSEPGLRLELYRRLARLPTPEAVTDLAEEMEDRFGELPDCVHLLLDQARLRAWCTAHRVTRLDAGPQAVALTAEDAEGLARRLASAKAKEGRVIVSLVIPNPAKRLRHLCANILS